MSKTSIKKGTKFLKQALIVLGLMALGLMLFQFIPVVFAQAGTAAGEAPAFVLEKTGSQGSARQLILNIVNFFLGFLGLLAVIMIIYGGMLYVSAAGKQESIDKGKKIIMYAVIGIVVILLSFAIVNTVLGGAGAGADV